MLIKTEVTEARGLAEAELGPPGLPSPCRALAQLWEGNFWVPSAYGIPEGLEGSHKFKAVKASQILTILMEKLSWRSGG